MRLKRNYALAGALCGGIVSMLVGLFSPYVYLSEAVIQLEIFRSNLSNLPITPMMKPEYELNTVLNKNILLIYSSAVIGKTADELSDSDIDYKLAFPLRFSLSDIKGRLHLVSSRLAGKEEIRSTKPGKEILTSLIRDHLTVTPSLETRTLKFSYEAGSPETARLICDKIIGHFTQATVEYDQSELKKQERYLDSTIEFQKKNIQTIEEQLQVIFQKHPHLASYREGDNRGAAILANSFSRRMDQIDGIEQEFEANQRFIKAIDRGLASKYQSGDVDLEVRSKLVNEISELEFKRLQYTKMTGYSDNHPEVRQILSRLKTLKALLQTLNDSSGAKGGIRDTKTLLQKKMELVQRNRQIQIQRDLLKASLAGEEQAIKKTLSLDFQVNALLRNLNIYLRNINELASNLQKVRMYMAGGTSTASVLLPASFSPFATNISVKKRVFFGCIVGAIFVLAFIYLIDLLNPRLLCLADLEGLGVRNFGLLQANENSIKRMASCIMSLGAQQAKGPKDKGRVVLLVTVPPSQIDVSSWYEKIAVILKEHNCSVGLLISDTQRDPTARQETRLINGIETVWLHPNEIAFSFSRMIEHMKSRLEWVFVVVPTIKNIPAESIIRESAEHIIYITELGHSEINHINWIKHSELTSKNATHNAFVFDS
ncbi:MAG: hypothetical protein HY537_00900 [Deltaproteobacteria bacterium]|nr:hypothetical protein [Deltaproteobacteria bacterium]